MAWAMAVAAVVGATVSVVQSTQANNRAKEQA